MVGSASAALDESTSTDSVAVARSRLMAHLLPPRPPPAAALAAAAT